MATLQPLDLDTDTGRESAHAYLIAAAGALVRATRALARGEAGKAELLAHLAAARLHLALLRRRCTEPVPVAALAVEQQIREQFIIDIDALGAGKDGDADDADGA